MSPRSLPPERLRYTCDAASLGFGTTDELADIDDIIGQPRAVEAVRFGIEIGPKGYNIFVRGPSGAGRYTLTGEYLTRAASGQSRPDDWCYVNNFSEPHKPKALRLPPGRGIPLREAMSRIVEDLRIAIPAAFESEEYQARRGHIESEFKQRQQSSLDQLREEAQRRNLALGQSQGGFAFAPMRDGQVMQPEAFNALPEPERQAILGEIESMQGRLEGVLRQWQSSHKEMLERLRTLNRSVTQRLAELEIEPLRRAFVAFPDVLRHLDAVRDDVVGNVFDFLRAAAGPAPGSPQAAALQALVQNPNELIGREEPPSFRRYQVNVIVDNADGGGAPVIFDDAPSVGSLIGRIEHAAQLGQLVTDFTLIKPGSLHRANGGYLIIDARKLLLQPFAYEDLKRALLSERIRIESVAQRPIHAAVATLDPEPIPLAAKVVLVGEPTLYHLLAAADPDFGELFKVQAELSDRIKPSGDMLRLYAQLIATMARREMLQPFDAGAVARIIEYSARLVEDQQRLSGRFAYILDIMREADHWRGAAGATHVGAEHVEHAVAARILRADRAREVTHESILRGWVLIDASGNKVGQVNGLAVLQLGNFAFGKPTRITARVRMGRGEVIDIERRVDLGGSLHAKGVYILAGYLGARYAADRPLALSASLVFEQSYGGVEGDSASSAELYALLSALSGLPIKQSLAVTGSVNQLGQVQAIGGVHEKIEGFFDICKARGLDGEHGVLIPESNVLNLMLRHDVIEAVRGRKFHVYLVRTIDDGIELLTGVTAGAQQADGAWTPGSVNARVAERLAQFAEAARNFAEPPSEPSPAESIKDQR